MKYKATILKCGVLTTRTFKRLPYFCPILIGIRGSPFVTTTLVHNTLLVSHSLGLKNVTVDFHRTLPVLCTLQNT